MRALEAALELEAIRPRSGPHRRRSDSGRRAFEFDHHRLIVGTGQQISILEIRDFWQGSD